MSRSLKLYFIAALLVNISQCYCICNRPRSLCGVYNVSRILEDSLVNNKDTLFMLRQGFFPSSGVVPNIRPIRIFLNVTQREPLVDCSPEESNPAFQLQEDQDGQYSYMGNWLLSWSTSPVLLLIAKEEILLFDSGIVSLLIMVSPTVSTPHRFEFVLNINESFHCIPTMQNLATSMTTLASWLKAYGRYSGIPSTWNQEDQGHVAWNYRRELRDTINNDLMQKCFRIFLLVTFVTLNILVAVTMAQLTPKAYAALTERLLDNIDRNNSQQLFSIYWAFVFVVGVINLVNTISSAMYHTMCLYTECQHYTGDWIVRSLLGIYYDVDATEKAIFIVKITLIPLLLAMGLLVSIRTDKHCTFPVPYKLVNILCCCFCCSPEFKSKFAQSVALWQILIFLQNLTCTLFPAAFFLLVNPLLAASIILFFISLFFTLVVVVSHLFKHCTCLSYDRRHTTPQCCCCSSSCLQLLAILTFIIFVFAFFMVYGIIISRGVTAGGLLTVVVTLVPSIVIDVVLGWHMKKTFFSIAQNRSRESPLLRMANLGDEIDIGDGTFQDEPLLQSNQ